jgi:uncharacterized protein YndB with AHSA1/START domain
MENVTVERSIWIKAPRERVWQAITDSQQLQQWWGDYWEITRLEVGATVKFGEADDPMSATIDVLDPPHQFRLLWPPQPQYHSIKIFTTFLLAEEKDGTRITVTETGFEALPDDIRQTRFDQTAKGYIQVLEALKGLLERETT